MPTRNDQISDRKTQLSDRKLQRARERSMKRRGVTDDMLSRVTRLGGVRGALVAMSGDPNARKARTYFDGFAPATADQRRRARSRADFLRSVEGNPNLQHYTRLMDTEAGRAGALEANGGEDRGDSGNYRRVAEANRLRNRVREAQRRGSPVYSVRNAEGKMITAPTMVSVGGRDYFSMSDALAAADRVAKNDQTRRGLLTILQRRGYKGGKDDKAWAEFNDHISQGTGADLSDDEREMLGKAMTGISQRAHDDVFAANKLYHDQVANLKGPRSRADAIAALRGFQKPPQYISPDMADNSDRYMGFVRAAAGVGAAAAAATGGRGYGRSYGSSGPAVGRATLNASVSGSNGKVSGWEKSSAISAGGGSDYGSISMGGAGSAGASAFRSALETSVNGDPGGLVRGFTPFGTPVFTKDRRGGYEHTSAEEKAYRRSVDKWEQESTRLLNDSIMNGGAGADYMENNRLMRAFERARYAANSRYINIMNDIREMSRLSGVRPETVSVPQQPEAPQPQQPQRPVTPDTPQGDEAGYDPDMLKPERREDE